MIDFHYNGLFVDLTHIEPVTDKARQVKGIDKIITCSGKKYNVDEKIREADYGDILLEVYSNKERKTPGWLLADNKLTDIVTYIIFEGDNLKRIHALGYRRLRDALLSHLREWEKKYGIRETQTSYGSGVYTTTNIPVPVSVLSQLLGTHYKAI